MKNYLNSTIENEFAAVDVFFVDMPHSDKVIEVRAAASRNDVNRVNELLNVNDAECWAWAAFGAAYGGYVELMNDLIQRSIEPIAGCAIMGAAFANREVLVNELLTLHDNHQDDVSNALYGAALGGHAELVKKLIDRCTDVSLGLKGASESGNVKIVNDLLDKYRERLAGGHFRAPRFGHGLGIIISGAKSLFNSPSCSEERAWAFAAGINDPDLRKAIIERIGRVSRFTNHSLIEQGKIIELMRSESKPSYTQAKKYISKGVSTALFELQRFVKDKKVLSSDFNLIMSYVINPNCDGMTDNDVGMIVSLANQRLRDGLQAAHDPRLFAAPVGEAAAAASSDARCAASAGPSKALN